MVKTQTLAKSTQTVRRYNLTPAPIRSTKEVPDCYRSGSSNCRSAHDPNFNSGNQKFLYFVEDEDTEKGTIGGSQLVISDSSHGPYSSGNSTTLCIKEARAIFQALLANEPRFKELGFPLDV